MTVAAECSSEATAVTQSWAGPHLRATADRGEAKPLVALTSFYLRAREQLAEVVRQQLQESLKNLLDNAGEQLTEDSSEIDHDLLLCFGFAKL